MSSEPPSSLRLSDRDAENSQLAHALDRLLTALADDVRRPELLRERDPVRMPPEQDDLFGAETLRRDHPAEADSAVSDDGNGLARCDSGRKRAVLARPHHVREGEKRRHQRVVFRHGQEDERSVRERHTHRLPLAAIDAVSRPEAACARRTSEGPRRRKTQVPSEQANGATTTSPGTAQAQGRCPEPQRILEAAKALFAERGFGVTLHEIAARAGVGVGTIYRHFPDKKPPVDAIFAEQLAEMTALFEQALADPDPWRSIVWVHEQALEQQAGNRGFKQMLLGTPEAPERAQQIRAQLRDTGLRPPLHDHRRRDGRLRRRRSRPLAPLLRHRPAGPPPRRRATGATPGPVPPERMEDLLVGTWKRTSRTR
jgi:AcrR family transcriptional regulator